MATGSLSATVPAGISIEWVTPKGDGMIAFRGDRSLPCTLGHMDFFDGKRFCTVFVGKPDTDCLAADGYMDEISKGSALFRQLRIAGRSRHRSCGPGSCPHW